MPEVAEPPETGAERVIAEASLVEGKPSEKGPVPTGGWEFASESADEDPEDGFTQDEV